MPTSDDELDRRTNEIGRSLGESAGHGEKRFREMNGTTHEGFRSSNKAPDGLRPGAFQPLADFIADQQGEQMSKVEGKSVQLDSLVPDANGVIHVPPFHHEEVNGQRFEGERPFDHFADLPVRQEARAFAPLYDRILIERDPEEVAAAPGSVIIIPPAWREKTVSGRIIAAGMGALDVMAQHGVRIGDRIMWAKYAGILGQEGQIRTDVAIPYRTMDVCALMVKDILFDYDLHDRLASGEQKVVLGSDNLHFIKDKE